MKTPREILLEQHRHLTPRLASIRNQVIEVELAAVSLPVRMWQELVVAARVPWLAVAAAWIGIACLFLSEPESGPGPARREAALPSTIDYAMAWRKELLAELREEEQTVVVHPKTGPRSGREEESRIV